MEDVNANADDTPLFKMVFRTLGPPDRTAVTLDAPLAGLRHTTSRWNARELEVTKQDDGGPVRFTFALVLPENALYGASPR